MPLYNSIKKFFLFLFCLSMFLSAPLSGADRDAKRLDKFFGRMDAKRHVAAPLPDPHDLFSWEAFYKGNDKDAYDKLAFPYYPRALHEDDLRHSLIDIQYLKARFGDEKKKMWITEMGIPSVPGLSDSPPSPNQRAEWMVKAHIVAMASGIVDCVFWGPGASPLPADRGAAPESGILFSDFSNMPARRAYRAMTRILKNATYVGEMGIHPDVKAFIFRKGKKKVLVCWSEREDCPLSLNSSQTMTLVNPYGARKRLKPVQGVTRFAISTQPKYLLGITNQADIYSSLKCSPDVIYAYPGVSRELAITLEKPERLGSLTGTLRAFSPSVLNLSENYWDFSGEDKSEFGKTIDVLVSPKALPGFYQVNFHADLKGLSSKSLSRSVTIRVIDPIRIHLSGRQEADRFMMETRIENVSLEIMKGDLTWELKPRGKVQAPPQVITLFPNDEITTQSNLLAGNKEARLFASFKLSNGYSIEDDIGLMSIPLRFAAPRVDGNLKEWINVPELRLDGRSQSKRNAASAIKENHDASGAFQFWMTETDLYIGAVIRDAHPMINPFPDNKMNLGDGVEIFLGLASSGDSNVYGTQDYHIGIAPGHKGRRARLWNWSAQAPVVGGEVASLRTLDGYVMEAKIPFSSLGAWKPERNLMIGFDVALNDLNDESGSQSPHTLIWNGGPDNMRNSSAWGLAIIW